MLTVPADVLRYSRQTAESIDFDLPPHDILAGLQIIVSTCGSAGSLRSRCDLFDVVVVDEASQAVEAEVLIPISLCKCGGIVVIAGTSIASNTSFL